MVKQFFETPEFKRLQKEWDAKLKDDGFSDIEYRHNDNGDSDFLAGVNGMYFVRKGVTRCEGDAEYYQLARAYRWHLRESGAELRDIRIWDLHTAGLSAAAISSIVAHSRSGVTREIARMRNDMYERENDMRGS